MGWSGRGGRSWRPRWGRRRLQCRAYPARVSAQAPFTEDQHPAGDLRAGGEHEPFRAGVRAGASGRDFTASMPALARTASNEAVNCPARSRTRNRKSAARSPRSIIRFRICWVVHGTALPAIAPASLSRQARGRRPCGRPRVPGGENHPPDPGAKAAEANAWAGCTRALHRRGPGMGATTGLAYPRPRQVLGRLARGAPGARASPRAAVASSDCRISVRRADRAVYSWPAWRRSRPSAVFAAWRTSGCAVMSSRSAHRASATPGIAIWSWRTVMGSVINCSDLDMSEAGERRGRRSRIGGLVRLPDVSTGPLWWVGGLISWAVWGPS